VSSADRVDDLVDVEKRDADAEQGVPTSSVVRAEDKQAEDEQVRQSLGVLRAVDGADAKGKESSKNASDCGIRA
jgi:hypothetical protein